MKYPAITASMVPPAMAAIGPNMDVPRKKAVTVVTMPVPHPKAAPTPARMMVIPAVPDVREITCLINLSLAFYLEPTQLPQNSRPFQLPEELH